MGSNWLETTGKEARDWPDADADAAAADQSIIWVRSENRVPLQFSPDPAKSTMSCVCTGASCSLFAEVY